MADGVRASSKRTRGLYVQINNASSSDLVKGGKNTDKITDYGGLKTSRFFVLFWGFKNGVALRILR